ncbi:response regulator [Pseudomonas sp. BGr12]|uniref:response regulator n=1 Tax=unclassified Pseudomonas TaxID=196821 RepID=UPI00178056AA|nr:MULTISPECIES: response regulator [unclassified Pseudomonas]MBD9500821.1 response regulator [Pseudomonas sp. PDM17]MBD9578907.1 response regulator [Pseudomonas sp. PDM23]MBD9674573.1 response regulator [Pseudomonas sp. PDM21]MDL2430386.1 response regulator [Pseudomonas sp. BJa5]
MSTILLVDGQPVLRDGVRALVSRAGHQVIGEADNGQDALTLCRERRPDVVIIELAIPRLGGLDVLRRLRAAMDGVRLLVFSAQEREVYAGRALQAGADAFVGKDEPAAELEKALAAVLRGRSYFPRGATQGPKATDADGRAELERLSGRELTVLEMLGRGLSNKEISDQLSLSYKTISTYKMRLHQKLNVSSDVQLLQVAQSLGLLAAEGTTVAPADPQLEHELGLLRALLDATPNPMFVRDMDSRLLLCNLPFLNRVGRTFEEVRGGCFEDAHWLSPSLRERTAQRYREAVLREEPIAEEISLDDSTIVGTYFAWCVPHRSADGRMLGMLGGMLSLDERDEQLAELRSGLFESRYRSHLKTNLLARIVADFREHLGGLDASVRRFGEEDAGTLADVELEASRGGLQSMLASLRQLDALLDLQHHVAERVSEAHELGRLTEEILQPQRAELQAAGYRLDLGPGVLSLRKVWIDAGYYRQLLEALIEAVPRNPDHATIRLQLSNWRYLKGLLRLRIEVSPWQCLARLVDTGEPASWARARVQRMVLLFHGELSQLEGEQGEGLLRLEFDLPLVI